MSAHLHREYVEGCFRCDLSREESAQHRASALARAMNADGSLKRGAPRKTIAAAHNLVAKLDEDMKRLPNGI